MRHQACYRSRREAPASLRCRESLSRLSWHWCGLCSGICGLDRIADANPGFAGGTLKCMAVLAVPVCCCNPYKAHHRIAIWADRSLNQPVGKANCFKRRHSISRRRTNCEPRSVLADRNRNYLSDPTVAVLCVILTRVRADKTERSHGATGQRTVVTSI
jgi:hypothetical protein